jgi:type IV pilus assembly protein PilQ
LFDPRTNQLFVTEVAARLEDVARLIGKIDVPVRQVVIEARIVEADDTFGRALGVKLGVNAAPTANSVSSGPLLGLDLPAQTGSLGGANAATSAVSLFGAAASRVLSVELSALEAQGKGRIVAHPRLITTDQKKALIEQGEELPYQAATSSGATNVQFRKANLKLEVVPMITPEGHVMLEVDVNKDSVGRSTVAGFAIDTKHIRTEVLVENGGTVVIGGIYTQTEKDGANQVPLLADMPFIGSLFQNRQRQVSKTELLVFLTPRVLSPPGGVSP